MPGVPALTEATYYILLSLHKPRHGYGIMQQTEELSGGRIRRAAGTLYGALNTLCDKGFMLKKRLLTTEFLSFETPDSKEYRRLNLQGYTCNHGEG